MIHLLEGDSYFVLKELSKITSGKNVQYGGIQTAGFLSKERIYVYPNPAVEELPVNFNFETVIYFEDKNVDLRVDWVKKIRNLNSNHLCFDPIPSTDYSSLKKVFPDLETNLSLPTKECRIKYKGSKQNYEWFDLALIEDLKKIKDNSIFDLFEENFNLWEFTDLLWNGNKKCIHYTSRINDDNFEYYFNRIRESVRDYLDVITTGAHNFYDHKKKYPNSVINNDYRFNKVKEKLNRNKKYTDSELAKFFDECLIDVRQGVNPKLALIDLCVKFCNG